ncbi:MAG: YceD family protein [Dehalobacterium sp.]|jgi:uncharacterized protein
MKVNVGKIKSILGKRESLEFKESLSQLMIEDGDTIKLTAPLEFSGLAENLGDRILIEGNIHTVVGLLCSRCMKPTTISIHAPFREIFANHKIEDDEEDEIFLFEGDEFDITPHVARAIILELPMKVLCKEDCQGFCSECGIDLNLKKCQCHKETIDPRFAVLKNLVSQSSTEGSVNSGSAAGKNIKGE